LTALQEESRDWSPALVEHTVQTSLKDGQPRFEIIVSNGESLVRACYGVRGAHASAPRAEARAQPRPLRPGRSATRGTWHPASGADGRVRPGPQRQAGSYGRAAPGVDGRGQPQPQGQAGRGATADDLRVHAEDFYRSVVGVPSSLFSSSDEYESDWSDDGEVGIPFEAPAADVPNEDVPEERACLICRVAVKTHAVMPCGHKCMCGSCSEQLLLRSSEPTCPVCRKAAVQIVQIFD